MKHVLFLFMITSITACIVSSESPIESSSNEANLIQTGDILISNAGTDSIILYNSEGTFKANLIDVSDSNLIMNGLAFDSLNDQILFTYDSATAALDSVKAMSLFDGSVSNYISNSNLTATAFPGIARLTGGDLLVLEGTNTAEKFLSTGVRSGNPFLNTITTNVADIGAMSNGGFVTCSSGVATTVRTYNSAGVAQASATSAVPAPSMGSAMAASGCLENPVTGQIVVAFNGANDGVRAFDSTLATISWTYQDTNYLANPGRIAVRPNGNILVLDLTANHIVELDTNGAFVRTIDLPVSTPNSILVVP